MSNTTFISMKIFELSGELREQKGKKASAELRQQDLIPCVLYGCGKENTNFTVSNSAVRKLVYTPHIHEVKLTIAGKTVSAVLKEIQFHPVNDRILHIDFFEVDEKNPIVFSVPVKIEGLAAGVRAGGKLSLEMRKLKVKALCKDIPEVLTINVESLEIGKTIKAGDLNFPKLQIMDNKNSLVVCVKATRAAKAAAEAAK